MESTTDLSTAMLARIRNHMLVALLGIGVGIGVLATGRVVGDLVFGSTIPGWWRGLSFLVGIGMIPLVGISATVRYLRCPGCNGFVGFQVSGQASFVADRYSKQCRHCGKTIFDGRFTRRMRILQVCVFFGTILFFTAMAVMKRGR
jgi:hypothetical protein